MISINNFKKISSLYYKLRILQNRFLSLVLSIESQLLYAACRPIYAVLTRLNQKQIDELKRDPSKYQCPPDVNARKVLLTRKAGPACKTRSRETTACAQNTSTSSKRKAPVGDESDLIVVEDDETNVGALTASTKEALTASTVVRSSTRGNIKTAQSVKEKKSGPTSAIILIDLCSSDEEEEEEEDQSEILTPCDENKDPAESPRSLLRKLTPNNKLHAKPCIYPATSSTERLSNHVLNEDKNENCTNKCRTGMLNGCVHLSSILRPAP